MKELPEFSRTPDTSPQFLRIAEAQFSAFPSRTLQKLADKLKQELAINFNRQYKDLGIEIELILTKDSNNHGANLLILGEITTFKSLNPARKIWNIFITRIPYSWNFTDLYEDTENYIDHYLHVIYSGKK